MKQNRIALILALSAPLSMPAMAGPNWDVIHKAEADKAAHKHENTLILPLDYGPRAITTPWLNHERLGRLIAQAEGQKKIGAATASKKGVVVATRRHPDHAYHS